MDYCAVPIVLLVIVAGWLALAHERVLSELREQRTKYDRLLHEYRALKDAQS